MDYDQCYTIRHKGTGLWWTGKPGRWSWSANRRSACKLIGEDVTRNELQRLDGAPVEIIPPLLDDDTAGLPLFGGQIVGHGEQIVYRDRHVLVCKEGE